MGRSFGLLVVLCALTACGKDEYQKDDTNSSSSSAGGTGSTGGAGATNAPGTGGTDPQGQGGTDSTSQGGAAGDASDGGTGGDPGIAGAVGDAGAAGAASCEGGGEAACEPCRGSLIHVECDERCVCEPENEPLKPVYDDLLACQLDEPCPPSERYDDPGSATWTGGACLLTALRDRTPGKYHHSTTTADIGTHTTSYTILLGQGGRVLVARSTTSGPDAGGNFERTYFPVWSCGLRSYDTLDDCLAAGTHVSPSTTGGEPAVCDSTEDWFDDCIVVENPECPVE